MTTFFIAFYESFYVVTSTSIPVCQSESPLDKASINWHIFRFLGFHQDLNIFFFSCLILDSIRLRLLFRTFNLYPMLQVLLQSLFRQRTCQIWLLHSTVQLSSLDFISHIFSLPLKFLSLKSRPGREPGGQPHLHCTVKKTEENFVRISYKKTHFLLIFFYIV